MRLVKIENFVKERDWDQFHSPKNLSMALSVEVSELVEIFQWLKEISINDRYKIDLKTIVSPSPTVGGFAGYFKNAFLNLTND